MGNEKQPTASKTTANIAPFMYVIPPRFIKSWRCRPCSIPASKFAPNISHLVAAGTYTDEIQPCSSNKANMRRCRNITRCRGMAQARLTMRLENEPTEIGKIKTRHLVPGCRCLPKRGSIAVLPTWQLEQKCSSLILAKNRFKHPFEISSAAFVHAASNARPITVLRSLGVLEDDMEHHVQILLALFISSALCLVAWIWASRRSTRLSGGRR